MWALGDSTYAPTYVLAMRDAHRKPYPSIRAPALTRHMVFRKSQEDAENEAKWVTRIESIILTCVRQLRSPQDLDCCCASDPGDTESSKLPPKAPPTVRVGNFRGLAVTVAQDSAIPLLRNTYSPYRVPPDAPHEAAVASAGWMSQTPLRAPGRYETVCIESAWCNLGVVLRFELFEEFFTCTVTLELRVGEKFAQEQRIDSAVVTRSRLGRALDCMISEWHRLYLASSVDGENGTADLNQERRAELCSATEILTKTVWDDFDRAVLRAAFSSEKRVGIFEYATPQLKNVVPRHERRAVPPEELMAHFTGVVLGLDASLDSPATQIRAAGIDSDFERAMSRARRSKRDFGAFEGDGAEHWAGALFPFLIDASTIAQRLTPDMPVRSPFETSEYTWSTFDDRRCLYGSGFGPQGTEGAPLQYVMLFDHDDHRSIGREVHRLHTLGTLRLAALIDADRSIRHGEVLTQLDAEMRRMEAVVGVYELGLRQWQEWEHLARSLQLLGALVLDERDLFMTCPAYPRH